MFCLSNGKVKSEQIIILLIAEVCGLHYVFSRIFIVEAFAQIWIDGFPNCHQSMYHCMGKSVKLYFVYRKLVVYEIRCIIWCLGNITITETEDRRSVTKNSLL